jgi:hypothetical protein
MSNRIRQEQMPSVILKVMTRLTCASFGTEE